MAFPDGWGRKQKITIQSSEVVGSGSHSNFPVLVTLDHLDAEIVDAGTNSALNGGGDIRFSSDSAGSTQLACEIVDFITNASAGSRRCEIWVKLPAISTSSNTDFYIWYKKTGESQPAEGASYGSEAVWSGWDYRTHDMLSDVTGNNTITQNNPGTVTDSPFGKNAHLFNGSNDYMTSTVAGLAVDNTNITMTVWARDDGTGDSEPYVIYCDTGSTGWFALIMDTSFSDGAATFVGNEEIGDGGGSGDGDGIVDGVWGYVKGTRDDSTEFFETRVNTSDEDDEFYHGWGDVEEIGIIFGAAYPGYNHFGGALAEFGIRLSLVSNHITDTEYNMMNDPASFAFSGTPEAVGGDISLTLADGSLVHGADNLVLAQDYLLEPNVAAHWQEAENLILEENLTLTVSESIHGQSAGSCDPIENIDVVPADTMHNASVDDVLIAQLHQVTINETSHVHNAVGMGIEQTHQIVPDDVHHTQTADDCTVGEFISVIIAGVDHTVISNTLDINQVHLLATANSLQILNSQNLSLSIASELVLTDAVHGHQIENLTLDNGTMMQVQSSVHAFLDVGLSIGYSVNLVTADATHTHFAGQVLVTQNHMLLVQGADHTLSCDDPSLQTVVSGDDNVHYQSSDTPDLSQVHILQEIDDHLLHSAEEPYVRIPLGIWGFMGEVMSSWTTQSEASNDWTELTETSNDWEDQ